MYTYPNTQSTPAILRKSTTTTKTYDEEGRLITEETYEEIEYAPTPSVLNQPWILTNTVNTDHRSHVHARLDGDVRKSDIDEGYNGI